MASPLALSPRAGIALGHFGEERQPLLTVDSALADPNAVVAIAARHAFAPIGPYYPGIRAAVSEAIAMPLIAPLTPLLVDAFGLDRSPRFSECFLSIVTRAPDNLAPIQRLPHFDGVEPARLAVLLYLDGAERGGTAFYRQRATGFESVDEARFEAYRTALDRGVAREGIPPAGYIAGDTALFAQIHAAAGAWNSMVVYRGNTLHCAHLAPGFAPDASPRTGRLTLNLFLD